MKPDAWLELDHKGRVIGATAEKDDTSPFKWEPLYRRPPEGRLPLKRYELEDVGHSYRDPNYVMLENPEGDYVKHEDIKHLEYELATFKEFFHQIAARVDTFVGNPISIEPESVLVERVHQFDSAIQRIASHVGAVCGGVDTGPRGGHTAEEIIRCIDAKVKAAYKDGIADQMHK